MCTLVLIHRQVPGRPLVVAANRDEYMDRPAEGLALRETPSGRVLAPLDVRAGGTWLGLNANGVFAALTNLRSDSLDPGLRSRGQVVMDALGAESAGAATEMLSTLEMEAYNPFNLVVADQNEAHLVVYQGRSIVSQLKPGVHVIGNVDASGPPNPKVKRTKDRAEQAVDSSPKELVERLAEICRTHEAEGEPLGDTCVHVEGTYGTRSSVILEIAEQQGSSRLLAADGPPCEVAYTDFSSLLLELRRRPGYGIAESLVRTAS